MINSVGCWSGLFIIVVVLGVKFKDCEDDSGGFCFLGGFFFVGEGLDYVNFDGIILFFI